MTLTDDIFNGKTTKRKELTRIKGELTDLHDAFSGAEDSQHTLLDVSVYVIDQILADNMYGSLDT